MKKILILVLFLAAGFAGCENNNEGIPYLYSYFDETGKYGYMDKEGVVKIEPQWDYASDFYMGYGTVSNDSKYGMVDKDGNVVVPIIYQNLGNINTDLQSLFNPELLIRAKKDGLWGYIDETGTVKIPFIYQGTNSFSDGLAAVKIGTKYGFINESGNLIIPAVYDGWGWFRENLAWVGILTDGIFKWGVINKAGETIVPFEYDNPSGPTYKFYIFQFVNGISPFFRTEGPSGFINTSGEWIFGGSSGVAYSFTFNFSEGLAPVCKDNLMGYIDDVNGVEVIPRQYDVVWGFWNGSSPFRYTPDGLWGYLEKNGSVLMAPQFLSCWSFDEESRAWVVYQDSTWGLINTSGKVIWHSPVVTGKSQKSLFSSKRIETGIE
jgi:hypothetical protein